jgi:2-isopropylmalate synthase
VNGIGERAGNASMEEIVMAIDTRRDFFDCRTDINTKEIMKASRLVSHLTGMVVQPNKAIVGRNAFWHASGIHQDGVLKKRQTYEIMDPKKIGLASNNIMLGKLSGRNAFAARIKKLGFHLKPSDLNDAFARFKQLADKKKYVFDEDLEVLLQDQTGKTVDTWVLKDMRVVSESGKKSDARIELTRDKKVYEAEVTGDGPVDACYKAIEKIIGSGAKVAHYGIQAVTGGMDAQGEVTVKLLISGKEVSGRGTSTDIIEASVRAYLFAINKVAAHGLPKQSAQAL